MENVTIQMFHEGYSWPMLSKIPVGVRIIDNATGMTAECVLYRSAHANKDAALKILKEKLKYETNLEEA